MKKLIRAYQAIAGYKFDFELLKSEYMKCYKILGGDVAFYQHLTDEFLDDTIVTASNLESMKANLDRLFVVASIIDACGEAVEEINDEVGVQSIISTIPTIIRPYM